MTESNAVIVGYFMNWFTIQENARAQDASQDIAGSILQRVIDKTMVSMPATFWKTIYHDGLGEGPPFTIQYVK